LIGLIQRVSQASVSVEGQVIGQIGKGLLVLVCAQPQDSPASTERFLAKVLKLRIFADENDKMNRSVQDIDGQGTAGGLLLVSQFTLAADVSGGNRPSFTAAAKPELARPLFDALVELAKAQHPIVQTGRFATDMQVALVNDGPITIPLEI
jgi:D-tyrosyl-tRNA(Tyr) deacylase